MSDEAPQPVPCEEALAFLTSLPHRPPLWERDIEELRRDTRVIGRACCGEPEPVASVEACTAAGVPARLYRPFDGANALLIWAHGGGWMIGDLNTHDCLVRALANHAGCAVLSVDYRLAPEFRYPAAHDDMWDATQWAATEFPAIAVGGDSAGANLAAAAALQARDAEIELALQVLAYPMLHYAVGSDEYAAFSERYANFGTHATDEDSPSSGYGVEFERSVEYFWKSYIPDVRARFDRDASPLRAETLSRVAPALIVIAEHDLLRAENEAYAARLEAEDVPVEVLHYDAQIHGFFPLLGVMQDAHDAVRKVGAALRAAFAVHQNRGNSSSGGTPGYGVGWRRKNRPTAVISE
jgi:acetyl esterase